MQVISFLISCIITSIVISFLTCPIIIRIK